MNEKTRYSSLSREKMEMEAVLGQRKRGDDDDDDDAKKKKKTTPPIACVVVCGKLHVRGVVGRLSRETSFFDDSRQSRQSRQSEKSGRSSSSIKVM